MAGLSVARRNASPRSGADSSRPLSTSWEYVPGRCNIGRDEIAARTRWGHLGVALTVALFVVLIAVGAPREARLLVFFTVAGAAVGYLQAWLRFCAAFGLLGIFNFGPLGGHQRVRDPAALRRDRRRALALAGVSAVIGAAVALVAYTLP